MPFVDYYQYCIKVSAAADADLDERQEIIISELSDWPFESFQIEANTIFAYIQAHDNHKDFLAIIQSFAGVEAVEITFIKGENWNQIWEQSFEPIMIDDKVVVRAPFHEIINNFEHDIIIEPKMSFGTGHHSTTRLMMENMLHLNLKNKSVLDMGCGTGILAILASKLGAKDVVAVDHDPQCLENSRENITLNHCEQIKVYGNDEISPNFKTDIILANIQKNVLMDQMPLYKTWLNEGGTLLVSGIYEEAVEDIKTSAANQNLLYDGVQKLNGWCIIKFSN